MSEETIDVGRVKVLWCLDHKRLAFISEHDGCKTEWQWSDEAGKGETIIDADDVEDWNACHRCGDDNIEANRYPEDEGRELWQTVTCNACGTEWIEVYKAVRREEQYVPA